RRRTCGQLPGGVRTSGTGPAGPRPGLGLLPDPVSNSAGSKIALGYPVLVRLSRGKQSALGRPWTGNRRFVLLSLIGVNVAAFVIQLVLETVQPGFVRDYLALSNRGVLDAYSWEFVTAA